MSSILASEDSGSGDCRLVTSSGFPEEAVKDSVPLLIDCRRTKLEPQALRIRGLPLRSISLMISGDVRLPAPWVVPRYYRYAT
jgi:hypothetical protein